MTEIRTKDEIMFDALLELLRETDCVDLVMIEMAKSIEMDEMLAIPWLAALRGAEDATEAIEYARREVVAPHILSQVDNTPPDFLYGQVSP